jgi:hypothetical protein
MPAALAAAVTLAVSRKGLLATWEQGLLAIGAGTLLKNETGSRDTELEEVSVASRLMEE